MRKKPKARSCKQSRTTTAGHSDCKLRAALAKLHPMRPMRWMRCLCWLRCSLCWLEVIALAARHQPITPCQQLFALPATSSHSDHAIPSCSFLSRCIYGPPRDDAHHKSGHHRRYNLLLSSRRRCCIPSMNKSSSWGHLLVAATQGGE